MQTFEIKTYEYRPNTVRYSVEAETLEEALKKIFEIEVYPWDIDGMGFGESDKQIVEISAIDDDDEAWEEVPACLEEVPITFPRLDLKESPGISGS
jgi:hypothetical protein